MLIYPLVAIVTLLSLLLYFVMSARVGRDRHKYSIEAPAVVGHPNFERDYRIQMNTLEWLPIFLPSLWLFAVAWGSDRIAAGIGLVWIVGRVLYLNGYAKAASARSPGFAIQAAATAVLLLGALGRLIMLAAAHGV
jgi:glutathione S-transferase